MRSLRSRNRRSSCDMRLDGCLMIIFDYRIFYRNIPDEGKIRRFDTIFVTLWQTEEKITGYLMVKFIYQLLWLPAPSLSSSFY